MAKGMKILAAVFVALTVTFSIVYQFYQNAFILAMGITFGTFAYHFLMRLAVGGVIGAIFKNRMDHTKWWFCPRAFEKKLYDILKVKRWKKYIPTYDPDTFSVERRSLEEIVMATCQSEIVHEVIVLLSFAPILFTIPFGEFYVFLCTSLAAAMIDCIFVILQRYNRPRLLKLLERENRRQ